MEAQRLFFERFWRVAAWAPATRTRMRGQSFQRLTLREREPSFTDKRVIPEQFEDNIRGFRAGKHLRAGSR